VFFDVTSSAHNRNCLALKLKTVAYLSAANSLWGTHLGGPPINGELLKFGIEISARSVLRNIMRSHPKARSQT
jgi:hypothetical protein